MKKKTTKIKFTDNPTKIPFIKCDVGMPDLSYILVDTGSESTLFDKSLLDNGCVSVTSENGNTNLVGFNGESDKTSTVIGSVTMTIADKKPGTVTVNGLVSDLSFLSDYIKYTFSVDMPVSMILGSDSLNKTKAKINYKKGEVSLLYDISGE